MCQDARAPQGSVKCVLPATGIHQRQAHLSKGSVPVVRRPAEAAALGQPRLWTGLWGKGFLGMGLGPDSGNSLLHRDLQPPAPADLDRVTAFGC